MVFECIAHGDGDSLGEEVRAHQRPADHRVLREDRPKAACHEGAVGRREGWREEVGGKWTWQREPNPFAAGHNGGTLVDAQGNVTLNNPGYRAALERMVNWLPCKMEALTKRLIAAFSLVTTI